MVATVDGFSHVLVVTSAAAARNPALSKVDFTLEATGLTLFQSGGATIARDAKGAEVFSSPAPLMWDSAAQPRTAVMTTELSGTRLRLIPAASMLSDPATVFPVYLDPPWNGGLAGDAWTTVWSRGDTVNSSFWHNSTAMVNGSTKGRSAPVWSATSSLTTPATARLTPSGR